MGYRKTDDEYASASTESLLTFKVSFVYMLWEIEAS